MRKIKITKTGFGSYVKLFFFTGIGMGTVKGIFYLIIGLFGGPVTVRIGSANYTGMTAAIIVAIMSPLLSGFIWTIVAVMIYLSFKLVLKIFKGISMNKQTTELPERGNDETK